VYYNNVLWTVLRPKQNELKWTILVITLTRQFVMCTSTLILEGAAKCRKPFLVRLTIRMEHYSEIQRIVFLEGLIFAELFKVIQDSYERLSFVADIAKYSEPADTISHSHRIQQQLYYYIFFYFKVFHYTHFLVFPTKTLYASFHHPPTHSIFSYILCKA